MMTKSTKSRFSQGQTRFSMGQSMVEGVATLAALSKKTTTSKGMRSDEFIRAQYIGPASGALARVVVSVRPTQLAQKAAIRSMNEELQGRTAESSTTSLDNYLPDR